VIFAIDHIVFCATPEQRASLITALHGGGFAALPSDFHLDFPEDGAASDSVGFRGGASLEFVYQTDAASGPGPWFAETPRVMGLGFSSDDFAADTDWDGDPGHWTMPEQQGFPNSAGPHEHKSDFYVFVMNRSDGALQFPELTTGPRLARITLAGQAAPQWRERLARWLKLPGDGDVLSVGDVELAFTDGPNPNVRATLTFETDGDPEVVGLSSGAIELAGKQAG
jgi:hypothetical protein